MDKAQLTFSSPSHCLGVLTTYQVLSAGEDQALRVLIAAGDTWRDFTPQECELLGEGVFQALTLKGAAHRTWETDGATWHLEAGWYNTTYQWALTAEATG
jgi:hypothetical protein